MGSQQRDGVQQCTKGWLQEVKSWFNFGRKTSPGSMWQCPKTRPNWARKVAISILALASSFSFSKPQLGPSLPIGGGGGNQLNRAIAAQQADYSSFPGGGNQLNRLIGARQADYSSFPGRDYQAGFNIGNRAGMGESSIGGPLNRAGLGGIHPCFIIDCPGPPCQGYWCG